MPRNDPLELVRETLAGRPAWLVGGALRDRALGRPTADLDIVIDGDCREAAGMLARAAGKATSFALSEEFGAWRVVARDGSWQIDVESLRGGSLEADLALRDFTVNAVAEPLEGGVPIDPLNGLGDLAAGRLRMAGPRAFVDDPLRVLRMVRIAVELELEPEPETKLCAREQVPGLLTVSPERVFIELRRTLDAPSALRGLGLLDEVGATATVLPELEATRDVQQSHFHHLDVHGHTLAVLERTIALQADPASLLGDRQGEAVAALLAEPLADGLTRGGAMRWGALLHDAAKPLTRAVRAGDGRVTFIGHDAQGAELARELGIAPGPRLGEILEELSRARYAGEIDTRAQALEHARALK